MPRKTLLIQLAVTIAGICSITAGEIPSRWLRSRDGEAALPLVTIPPKKAESVVDDTAAKKLLNDVREALTTTSPPVALKHAKEAGSIICKLVDQHPNAKATADAMVAYGQALGKMQGQEEVAVKVWQRLARMFPEYRFASNGGLTGLAKNEVFYRMCSGNQVEPDERFRLMVGAKTPEEVTIDIHRVDLEKILESGELLRPISIAQLSKPAATMTFIVPKVRGYGPYFTGKLVHVPKMPEGAYIVHLHSRFQSNLMMFTVSKLRALVRTDGRMMLAFAANSKKKQKAGRCKIWVADRQGGIWYRGKTNADGIFAARIKGDFRDALVAVEQGGSVAFAAINHSSSFCREIVTGYTNRPVFRPGQTAHIKTVARKLDFGTGGLTINRDEDITLSVTNTQGTLIYQEKKKPTAFGTAAFSFEFSDAAETGEYKATFSYGHAKAVSTFEILAYRKPDFSIDVNLTSPKYAKNITCDVSSNYFSGEPVQDAAVLYHLCTKTEKGNGRIITWGRDRLDGRGKCRLEIPLESKPTTDLILKVFASDNSRREALGSAAIESDDHNRKVSLKAKKLCAEVGEELTVRVKVTDGRGRPAAAPVTLLLMQEDKGRQVAVNKTVAKVGDAGTATVRFRPKQAGRYTIKASAAQAGNPVRTPDMIVLDAGAKLPENLRRLGVWPSLATAKPGSKLPIYLTSEHANEPLLLSMTGTFLDGYILTTSSDRPKTIVLPIDGKTPADVSICADTAMQSSQSNVNVDRAARQLRVHIEPDKETYAPGESARFTIRVVDWQNKPVAAEVSLGLIDLALYSLAKDNTPDLHAVFDRTFNNKTDIERSVDFRPSHFGYGLFPERPMLDPCCVREIQAQRFYAARYGCMSRASRAVELPPEMPGGIRSNFADCAYWKPDILTGADGTATVSFVLPDNLTTWRCTAIAVDRDARVGKEIIDVKANKSFYVRMITPRFFTSGDKAKVSAMIHNQTPTPETVKIHLKGNGFRLAEQAAKEATVSGNATSRVDWLVDIGSKDHAKFELLATTKSQQTDAVRRIVPVSALDGASILADTRNKPPVPLVAVNRFYRGALSRPHATEVLFPRGAVDSSQLLRLRVMASTYLSLLFDGLKKLTGYPYGCVEQTMSRFLPNLVVCRMLNKTGAATPAFKEDVRKYTHKGLQRLYSFQHQDGGWGWWKKDKTDPFMTAYVMIGFAFAKEQGHFVSEPAVRGGIKALRDMIVSRSPDTTQALLVYAYSRHQPLTQSWRQRLHDRRQKLSSVGLAMLAQIHHAAKDVDRAKMVIRELEKKAVRKNGSIKWGKDSSRFWGESSSFATAQALMAIKTVDPNDPLVARVTKSLIGMRSGRGWGTTKDTSAALLAICGNIKHLGTPVRKVNINVMINGKLHKRIPFELKKGKTSVWEDKLSIKTHGAQITLKSDQPSISVSYVYSTHSLVPENLVNGGDRGKVELCRSYFQLIPIEGVGGARRFRQIPLEDEVSSGDLIQVKLVVKSSGEIRYAMLEDQIPAGCEIVTHSKVRGAQGTTHQEARDDRMVFCEASLRGTRTYEYLLRAETPGSFTALPARVQAVYSPELQAQSKAGRIVIGE